MDAEHTEILAKIAIPLRELVDHLQGAVDAARQVSQSVDSALKAPDVQATPWTVKFRHATRGVNIAEVKMPEVPRVGMQLQIHDEASGLDLIYEVTDVKAEPHRLKARCMVRGPIELPPEAVPPEQLVDDVVGTLKDVLGAKEMPGSPLDETVAKAISKTACQWCRDEAATVEITDSDGMKSYACETCKRAFEMAGVPKKNDESSGLYKCSTGCGGHRMGQMDCYGNVWWKEKPPEGPLDAPYVPGAVKKPMTDKEMGEIGQFDSSDRSYE